MRICRPAALLLFGCIGWFGLVCLQGVRKRGRDWVFPATGLAVTVLVAVHSAFDFSLQMPGVAITYASIMGVSFAQSYSSRRVSRHRRQQARSAVSPGPDKT